MFIPINKESIKEAREWAYLGKYKEAIEKYQSEIPKIREYKLSQQKCQSISKFR